MRGLSVDVIILGVIPLIRLSQNVLITARKQVQARNRQLEHMIPIVQSEINLVYFCIQFRYLLRECLDVLHNLGFIYWIK
jgi:hypothetical protein